MPPIFLRNSLPSSGLFQRTPSYSHFYLHSYHKHVVSRNKPNTGYTRYMITFISISMVLLIVPYLLHAPPNLNSVLQSTLEDSSVKTMASISFGISIPLLFELMTSSVQTQFYWLRLVTLVLLEVPCIIITFNISIQNFDCLYMILTTMAYHFISGLVLTIIYKSYKQLFRPSLIWLLLIGSKRIFSISPHN